MFDNLSRGIALARQSWQVLMKEKGLLLLPVLSGFVCLLLMAGFVLPMYTSGYIDEVADYQAGPILACVAAFAYYFLSYFVIVFFNAALVACAVLRFQGDDPTLGVGFRAAMRRIPQIAGWAVVSASIGMVFRALESQSDRFGSIVGGLLGAAWSVMTFFVVPILVVEGLGPIAATRRSKDLFQKTWGESLTAQVGIGLLSLLAGLPGLGLVMFGGHLASNGDIAAAATLIGVGAVLLVLVGIVSSTLHAIALGGLYVYAADGEVPTGFDDALAEGAFGP